MHKIILIGDMSGPADTTLETKTETETDTTVPLLYTVHQLKVMVAEEKKKEKEEKERRKAENVEKNIVVLSLTPSQRKTLSRIMKERQERKEKEERKKQLRRKEKKRRDMLNMKERKWL